MLLKIPDSSGTIVCSLSKVLLLASVGTVLTALPGWAAVLKPTSVTVTVPPGTRNTGTGSSSSGYNDDISLQSFRFAGTTFQSSNDQFRSVLRARVLSGANNVNAEYGDRDNGSDSNANPFVSAGIIAEGATLPSGTRESTTPNIQNPAIRSAFSSLSVSQGIDGESAPFSLQVMFKGGIADNSTVVDQLPELVFFERGANSPFTVQAITNTSLENPNYAPTAVNVIGSNYYRSGIHIDTIEIGSAQELGVVGIDLNDFGLNNASDAVFGVRITSNGGSGADLYGQLIAAEDESQYRVPEPLTILGSGVALGFGALMQRMQRQNSKKLQKA